MNILLTNYDLSLRGGSETWVMTMYKYLSRDHDVDVYNAAGKCLINASCDEKKAYDLAIINHNVCLKDVKNWNIKKRIYTSHGVIPDLERPTLGADIYVAVSEEVQAMMQAYGFDATIIRNPINTDYFKGDRDNGKLKNILYLHNHAVALNILYGTLDQLRMLCAGYNLEVITDHVSCTRDAIRWADLVISKGRGCYEAMSCGKNVMIANGKDFDGMITSVNIFELRKNNCSGRRYQLDLSAVNFNKELGKYDPDRNMRPYILEYNNVEHVARQYLEL